MSTRKTNGPAWVSAILPVVALALASCADDPVGSGSGAAQGAEMPAEPEAKGREGLDHPAATAPEHPTAETEHPIGSTVKSEHPAPPVTRQLAAAPEERPEPETKAPAKVEAAPAKAAPTEPVAATTENFSELTEKGIVLVDFWAPWCGWCRRQMPIVKKLAGEYSGKVTVVTVNTDEYSELAQRHGVRGLPTLILFQDGRRVTKFEGFRPEEYLREVFDAALSEEKEM